MEIKNNGANNFFKTGERLSGIISIDGNNNSIIVGNSLSDSNIYLYISGDNNRVSIGNLRRAHSLRINIGNHVKAHGASVDIGDNFSCENDVEFFVYNSLNVLSIGDDCMFSRQIVVRTGESPHLIFDDETGEYLDKSDGVYLGNHVWVGERVYITKRCRIADNSIVAACAVVTKVFDEPHCAIGGNPATVVRRGVRWFRNHTFLEQGSAFRQSWEDNRNAALSSIDKVATV